MQNFDYEEAQKVFFQSLFHLSPESRLHLSDNLLRSKIFLNMLEHVHTNRTEPRLVDDHVQFINCVHISQGINNQMMIAVLPAFVDAVKAGGQKLTDQEKNQMIKGASRLLENIKTQRPTVAVLQVTREKPLH